MAGKAEASAKKRKTPSKPKRTPLRAAISSGKSTFDIKRKRNGELDLKAKGPPAVVLGVGGAFDIAPWFAPAIQPWSAVAFGIVLAATGVWYVHPWFTNGPTVSSPTANLLGVSRRSQSTTVKTKGLVASLAAVALVIAVHLWLYPGADFAFGLAFALTAFAGIGLIVWLRRTRMTSVPVQ